MENFPPKHDHPVEQKLDEVLKVLREIEKQGRRNFWGGSVKFLILNFVKILASILMLVFLWKIWGVVDGISGGLDTLLEKASSLKFW